MSPEKVERSIFFIGGVAALLYALYHFYAPDGLSFLSWLGGYYDAALEKAGILLSQGKRWVTWVLASEYGDRVRLFLYVYLVYAVAALLFPGYPKTFRAFSKIIDKDQLEIAKILGVLGGVLILCWFAYKGVADRANSHPSADYLIPLLILFFPAIGGLLVMIGIAISSVVWIPVLLIVLPGILAALFRSVFTLVILAPMKGLIAIWRYLHYLFVLHPAETVYRQGMEKHVPLPELAANVANAMYTYDFSRFWHLRRYPPAWVSQNQERRIRALCKKVEAQNDFMEELKRYCRLKEQLREEGD
jgi:hypothetical protein